MVRVGALASRQCGRISTTQLTRLGVDDRQISRWLTAGFLHRVHPHVYAVGHVARSHEGDLSAALLYAGPGAMLAARTEAWWLGVFGERPPVTITVATPRRCRSRPGIVVQRRRPPERLWWGRGDGHTPPRSHARAAELRDRGALALHGPELPVAPLPELALQLAAELPHNELRYFLANLDYRRWLDTTAMNAACRQGKPGSTALTRALKHHQPLLANTKSRLERKLILLCERFEVPLPEINVWVHGVLVDAYWPEQGLVVELDGAGNHEQPGQVRSDRPKELRLRRRGLTHRRYGEDDVDQRPRDVANDILQALAYSR